MRPFVATSSVEVGVRDLKNALSRYLDRVKHGDEAIVTDRGARSPDCLLFDSLTVGAVSDELVVAAADLAEQESLRGYAADHLAAALLVESRVLTSADRALCEAASRCGMYVANPLDA